MGCDDMRISHLLHHRRMMCLVLLSAWSFAMMLFLWKQIQDNDEFDKEKDQPKRNDYDVFNDDVFKRFAHQPKHLILKKLRFQLRNSLKREQYEGSNNRHRFDHLWTDVSGKNVSQPFTRKPYTLKIQMRSTEKIQIDYGRDRDVEVEGVNDYIMWHENFLNKQILPTLPRQRQCSEPARNVAFLKTHYTGSNVITNILNRYGDLNNLNIALPNDGLSTFFWPMRFQWKYIDITLLNGSLPNIVANHARYNNDVMDNILYPGSAYITILRDPVTQLETTFNNLGFGELLEIWNSTNKLKTFLDNPRFYIQRVIKGKRFKDTLNLIKNGQFFDLGLPTTDYHRKNIIKQAIQELYDKFSLVLIYEHLDESLVLLKRRLCWQFDDILYLKFHDTKENTWNHKVISDELRQRIQKWNKADTELYSFFNRSLWTDIQYEGKEFWKDLEEFKRLQNNIEGDCLGHSTLENNEQFFLDADDFDQDLTKYTRENARILFMKSFQKKSRLDYEQYSSSGDDIDNKNNSKIIEQIKMVKHRELYNKRYSGTLLTDEEREASLEGSGGFLTNNETPTTERILSIEASAWNKHFCKKLILNELEYLNYFRKKHAYAKSINKHP